MPSPGKVENEVRIYRYNKFVYLVLDVIWPEPMVIKLPSNVQTDEVTFLSVWCRKLGINFGHVEFPLKNKLYN